MPYRRIPVLHNANKTEPWKSAPEKVASASPHWIDACSASPSHTVPIGQDFLATLIKLREAGRCDKLFALRYRLDTISWGSRTAPFESEFRPEWAVAIPAEVWWQSAQAELQRLGGWPDGHTTQRRWFSELASKRFAIDRMLPVLYYDQMGVICDLRIPAYRQWAAEQLAKSYRASGADAVLLGIKTSDAAHKWPRKDPRFRNWTPYTVQEWRDAWGEIVSLLHAAEIRVITVEQQPDDGDWLWAKETTQELLLGEYDRASK